MPAILFLIAFTVPLFCLDLALEQRKEEYLFESSGVRPRFAAALGFLMILVLFSANSSSAFIYFQF